MGDGGMSQVTTPATPDPGTIQQAMEHLEERLLCHVTTGVTWEDCLNREHEYFLIFDELDLDFAITNQTYLDSIIGLILATQDFTSWARREELPIAVVVLLRDDIFASLQFSDKNKVADGLVETLQWNAGSTGPNSLKSIIDARIRVLLELSDAFQDPWRALFDDEVMRGKQHKYVHMAQRTYYRPRDLIQFANFSIGAARRRRALINGSLVSNNDITSARTPYSKYLRKELADEIQAHFPNWERWLDLLRHLGRVTFNTQQFQTEVSRSPSLLEGLEQRDLLAAMYQFGIIGFARRGGTATGGTSEYWAYRDPDVSFDHEAPYYRVHLGLKENLDLREGRER